VGKWVGPITSVRRELKDALQLALMLAGELLVFTQAPDFRAVAQRRWKS